MIVKHDVNTFDCTVSVAGPSINWVRKKAIQLLRHLIVVMMEQPNTFSAVVLFSENYILDLDQMAQRPKKSRERGHAKNDMEIIRYV